MQLDSLSLFSQLHKDTQKRDSTYSGLTARVTLSNNFAIGSDQFFRETENKYRFKAFCSYTESLLKYPFSNIAIPPPNQQILLSVSVLLSLLVFLHSVALEKSVGRECRQAKEPFKRMVGKSDPCWMNEDKLAGHWTNRKSKEKWFKVVLLEEERKCFVLFLNHLF